jgi:HIRAN domain
MDVKEACENRLYVAQQLEDASIHPVARLSVRRSSSDNKYEFRYLQAVCNLSGFSPFLAFPDIHRRYESETLFPFFQNRVLGVNRPEYPKMLESLDLSTQAEPFEVLARSGGLRQTDQIELFPEPTRDPKTGHAICRFFVRGVRYLPEAAENILRLDPLAELKLIPEPTNANDSEAIRITTNSGIPLGYVPRYLTAYIAEATRTCEPNSTKLRVVKIGDPALGFHTRLMAEYTCCWLDVDWPFSRPDFAPCVSG